MKTKYSLRSSVFPCLLTALAVLLITFPLHSQTTLPQVFTITTSSEHRGFDGQVQQSGDNSASGTIILGTKASKLTGFLMFDISSMLIYSADEIVSVTLSFQKTGATVNDAVDIQHSLTARTEKNFDGVWTSTGAVGTDWESVGRIFGKDWVNNVGTIDVTSMFLADLANTSGASVVYSSFRMFAAFMESNARVDLASSENATSGILIPTLTVTVHPIPEPAQIAMLFGIGALVFIIFSKRCSRT